MFFNNKKSPMRKEFCRSCSLYNKCKKENNFRLTIQENPFTLERSDCFVICENETILDCIDSFLVMSQKYGSVSCMPIGKTRIEMTRNEKDVDIKIINEREGQGDEIKFLAAERG